MPRPHNVACAGANATQSATHTARDSKMNCRALALKSSPRNSSSGSSAPETPAHPRSSAASSSCRLGPMANRRGRYPIRRMFLSAGGPSFLLCSPFRGQPPCFCPVAVAAARAFSFEPASPSPAAYWSEPRSHQKNRSSLPAAAPSVILGADGALEGGPTADVVHVPRDLLVLREVELEEDLAVGDVGTHGNVRHGELIAWGGG